MPPQGISLLVENNGWMRAIPMRFLRSSRRWERDSPPPPTPATGRTSVRYAGLAKAFPLAVTCDFKAMQLGPDGEHAAYDLKRCFQIGWDAGFRGPWCLEHFNDRSIASGKFRPLARYAA